MCSCHSILECCVMFSGVKLSIRSFVLFLRSFVLFLRSFVLFLRSFVLFLRSFVLFHDFVF